MSYLEDDDEWQDMPVIKPALTALDEEDKKLYHWNSSADSHLRGSSTSTSSALAGGAATSNATGKLLDFDEGGREWREKDKLDEMDYTRLELDDDPEEDEISMRTQYLFNEEKGMTPLAQMQATKTLLTEGQRIAYVGLCRLVAREMVQTLKIASKGATELEPATESTQNWSNKIMGRLYRHMEVDGAEQRMIEQLAEHGVTAEDLVPSLVTTHVVDNPEYDPEVAKEVDQKAVDREVEAERLRKLQQEESRIAVEKQWELERLREAEETAEEMRIIEEKVRQMELDEAASQASLSPRASQVNPFGDDDEDEVPSASNRGVKRIIVDSPKLSMSLEQDDDEGDIGAPPTPAPPAYVILSDAPASPTTPSRSTVPLEDLTTPRGQTHPPLHQSAPSSPENSFKPLPSTLPGVSTTLTPADKTITLDIRWTILCDLFLSLIADSVYDARSRVLLGRIAEKLGLEWIDVVRFERRLTEALEIQEGVQKKEHSEVLEDKRKQGKRQRYLMMGLATLGGGLVIGLSAGLLAPVIGAGLGAAFTTIGVTGTTGFLAGAGGAAVVTSGGIVSGSYIGGKAMGKRTSHVKTFEFQPLHNNKRVSFFIAVPGFMNGPLDDVRLPFSTIDPVMGDLFAVLWEPEMMGDTGNALKILTSEVLTQVGQQVLAMTVMTALLSALQWPMMLTKLGYLIDNPWSNALDRARQAGAVLADILMNRDLGVRPVSLIGFSLGARVIFYALVELAKAKAFGVVQEVYLFGATLTAPKKLWRQVRGVVAGRFVNAYAMNDWVLGYLFRATSGGLNTVAGLRPIEHVPDLENVDITEILVGHMSYRTLMPTLLAHVGFKTTADHFDEPEDINAPEREVVSTEEEAKRQEQRDRSKLGIFDKLKKKSSPSASPQLHSRTNSTTSSAQDDEDLPPRLPTSSTDNLHLRPEIHRHDSRDSVEETASSPVISSPVPSRDVGTTNDGFDIAQLRREVAQSSNPFAEPSSSSTSLPSSSNISSDPRDILRNDWKSSSALSPSEGNKSTASLQNDWSSSPSATFSSPIDAPEFRSSSAAEMRPPLPTFAFADSNGAAWKEDEEISPPTSNPFDDSPDPASSAFVWGKGVSSQNPW